MADPISNTPDYTTEITPLQVAADKIPDEQKRISVQAKLKNLRASIADGKKEEDVRAVINSLKAELTPDTVDMNLSASVLDWKRKIEQHNNEKLTPATLSDLLKELPKDDPECRSMIMRYIIGKLRLAGYNIILTKKCVSITTKTECDLKNAALLQETFENHMDLKVICREDIERALIISSGSLQEFSDTYGGTIPEGVSNRDYVKKLMLINKIRPEATPQEIECNPNLNDNEKSLIISYVTCGISSDSLKPTFDIYKKTEKQAEEIFSSPVFKAINGALNKSADKSAPPESAAALARRVTENPTVLHGKPLTTIAAVVGGIFLLGYQGKGKGFNFWSGLKRGFIGILAILVGNGVAKEWGMDPKKLIKETMAAIKTGGENTVENIRNDGNTDEKTSDKESNLSPSQAKAVKIVNADQDLKNKIEKHISHPTNEQGKLSDYLNFIHSSDFQNKKLSNIIYTKNPEASIFVNSEQNELNSIKPNLNPLLLKRVIRTYLLGISKFDPPEKGKKEGEKEKGLFLNKYPPDNYKDKNFKEMAEETYN